MLWLKILIPISAELEFGEVGFTGFLSGERGFEESESEGALSLAFAFIEFSSSSFTFELGSVFVESSIFSFTFLLSKVFSKSNRRFMEFFCQVYNL
ncbi:hypothetical protein LEP1GSC067_4892 [Leptospira interrogans serovar Lora str. TE 1992]|uniref:Uncharacterized protein n=1 Tax=Leptospira interrogans serovar Lora str. TE 1992 TaxID=1193028 RepID=M3F290_LEPIR|nr:hypothetical protein LEP1GSC067_4892 [Leptospira interrogans serovar Lora str. TE 1992]